MAKIVIDIPDFLYEQILKKHVSKATIARVFKNGKILPKGHFIAICESDYPITEKVENTLKETAFIGGAFIYDDDEEEEDRYCFDIKEIIKADKENDE